MIHFEKDPTLKSLLLQESLKARGVYTGELDNFWGPKSEVAYQAFVFSMQPKELTAEDLLNGTPIKTATAGWEFMNAMIVGDDIVIEKAVVTAFGGANDKMDSGETASGLSTKDNPTVLGCALPMRRDTSSVLRGSPIPKLPWFIAVHFIDPVTGRSVETRLIDEGPAKWTKHAGDLSVAAAKVFDSHATANRANIPPLTIRIMGGAKYVKA